MALVKSKNTRKRRSLGRIGQKADTTWFSRLLKTTPDQETDRAPDRSTFRQQNYTEPSSPTGRVYRFLPPPHSGHGILYMRTAASGRQSIMQVNRSGIRPNAQTPNRGAVVCTCSICVTLVLCDPDDSFRITKSHCRISIRSVHASVYASFGEVADVSYTQRDCNFFLLLILRHLPSRLERIKQINPLNRLALWSLDYYIALLYDCAILLSYIIGPLTT